MNDSLREQLVNVGLVAGTMARGDIYIVDDLDIVFPERPTDCLHSKERPVVLMQNQKQLNDPRYPHVSVIPITTKLESETEMCLKLDPSDGVQRSSLAKVGLIQPILKAKLKHKWGQLSPKAFTRLEAQLAYNHGLIDEIDVDEEAESQSAATTEEGDRS